MSDQLGRRYRRWLRFYPPGARRDEMLYTLLECAPPERTRPTPREIVNIAGYGLRARLGRPASTAIVVLAALVALSSGLLGAAGASRVGWELAPPLPHGAESDALKATVFPGLTVWGGGDSEPFVSTADGDSTQYGFADYWVKHTPQTRDVRTYAAAARDRLAAAGWEIRSEVGFEEDDATEPDAIGPPTTTAQFWATRDGLVLTYHGVYWEDRAAYDSDGAASFELSRSAPGWLWTVAVAGGILAALAGWLVTGWASRRTEEHEFRAAGAAALGWMAVLLILPAASVGTLWAWQPDRPGDEKFWIGLRVLIGFAGLVAGGLGLGALWIAWRPSRWRALLPAALVLVAVGAVAGWPASVIASCAPSGPPAEPPAGAVAHSRVARVFMAQDSTDEQRNYAEAAIFRVWGTRSLWFHYDPSDREYRYAYCDGGRLEGDSGMRLPYFFEIGLSSPGVYPALVAEVGHMPGVVAVRHGEAYL